MNVAAAVIASILVMFVVFTLGVIAGMVAHKLDERRELDEALDALERIHRSSNGHRP
jgi:sensor domain CHASE-containing protein